MSKSDVKKIIKAFADLLKKNRVAFRKIYLYGSYATGKAHEHSDIDVAIVMGRMPRGLKYWDRKMDLRKLGCRIDTRIEPILLEEKDIKKGEATIMGEEVRKHGILVVSA